MYLAPFPSFSPVFPNLYDRQYDDSFNNSLKKRFFPRGDARVIISRHGERVDTYYGPNWVRNAFDMWGNYRRFDSNMPMRLPVRRNFLDYNYDPPITLNGEGTAKSVGRILLDAGNVIDRCYSSPALRSVQTASNILEGMGLSRRVPIKVEPGLFECVRWYGSNGVVYMYPNELAVAGFYIDKFHAPIVMRLNPKEDELEYYERSAHVMKLIGNLSGTTLIVGHAASPEVLSRCLLRLKPRPEALLRLANKVDFGSLSVLDRYMLTNRWHFRNDVSV